MPSFSRYRRVKTLCQKIQPVRRQYSGSEKCVVEGISKGQSRQHRVQRNHITCCLWVWVSLTRAARAAGQTIYQLKERLRDDYIRQQLQKPAISINIA